MTDFGMARLGDVNPRATFTMCPGADVYMPPEAIQDQPVYSEKIDCFSFGVIVVQMLTRQFPNPCDRMQKVEIHHPDYPLMECIPEVDRRQNHISVIDPNHTLLPISLDCLKDRDVERPSAQQLCERVAALKEQSQYIESARSVDAFIKERDFHQSQRNPESQKMIELQELLSEKDGAIAARDEAIVAKEHEIQDLIQSHDEAIQERDREIHQLREQLQQVVDREDETTTKTHDPSIVTKMSISNRQECAYPSDIKLRWKRVKSAPKEMYKWGNAAVGINEVYFNAGGEKTMYSYTIDSEQWSQLPDCPKFHSSFVVIDNLLTAIGGQSSLQQGRCSDKLYCLKQRVLQQPQWLEEFPPMPRKKTNTISVCTNAAVVVVGEYYKTSIQVAPSYIGKIIVSVMNRETQEWSIADSTIMPSCMRLATGVICGDHLYVGGGRSKSVYACSLSDLLQSCQTVSAQALVRNMASNSSGTSIWKKLAALPGTIEDSSTLLSLRGQLLAVGGRKNSFLMFSGSLSDAVYIYKTTTNSWERISHMLVARRHCFAVTLPTNKVIVVGGYSENDYLTDAVEFADFI